MGSNLIDPLLEDFAITTIGVFDLLLYVGLLNLVKVLDVVGALLFQELLLQVFELLEYLFLVLVQVDLFFDETEVRVKVKLAHELLLGVVVDQEPSNYQNSSSPQVHLVVFEGEVRHDDDQEQHQTEEHVPGHLPSDFAATLVNLEVYEDEVVLVNQVLNVEEQECKCWDVGHQNTEKKAVEEYD